MASGELAKAEKINATTASAQLLVLSNTDLVSANRVGKRVIYQARYDSFQQLIAFLMEDCCAGSCFPVAAEK
jgi:DNA-binding transcriptional ArsR family regulator